MSKKSLIERNKKREKLVAKYLTRRQELLAIIHNNQSTQEEIFLACQEQAKLPRNSSKTRIRNRCVLTGRARAFYRKFKISRIALRELASSGQLPGVTKASW